MSEMGSPTNLRRIAWWHRALRLNTVCLIMMICVVIGVDFPSRLSWLRDTVALLLFVLALSIFALCALLSRARGMLRTDIGLLCLLSLLVPFGAVIAIVCVDLETVRMFRRMGVRVGVLGVSHEEMRKLRDGVCRACGYTLEGLRNGMCPECGRSIEEEQLDQVV